MKIAVCYSGMFRSINSTFKNHVETLFKNHDCDFYFSFWDVYGEGGFNSKYSTTKRNTWDFEKQMFFETEVGYDKISQSDIDELINKINPVRYEFHNFDEYEPLFDAKAELMDKVYGKKHSWLPHLQNVMSMYYKIYSCNNLVKNTGKEYDCVLRLRSDLIFRGDEENLLFTPKPNTVCINSWGTFNENYQDMIIYGDMIGMDKLSNLFFDLENIWKKLGRDASNESLLHHYLNKIDVNINLDTHINFYKIYKGEINIVGGHYDPLKN